jgi:PAS domain S-box-containing protein
MTGTLNHYQQFWDSFSKIYLLVDNTGKIIDFNKKACTFFGYTNLELKHLNKHKLFLNDEGFTKYLNQREETGAATAVLNALLKDGKVQSVHITARSFYDEVADVNRSIIIGDVAEQAHLEQVSNNGLNFNDPESLIKLMNIGVIVHDKDGAIVEFNNKAIELLFVNEGIAVDGNRLEGEWELVDEQMLPIKMSELPHVVAKVQKKRVSSAVIGLKRKNRIKWLIVDAQPAINKNNEPIVIETLTNITKQIEYKNKLYATKSFLEQTSSEARIGSWEFFPETGELVWSKVTKEIHEVSDDFEPSLNTAINFYEPDYSKNKINDAVNSLLSTGKSYALDLQIITAKGKLVWVRALGHAEFNEGVCYRIFGTFQDINDQKHKEIKLQEKEAEITEIYNTISDIVFKIAVEDIGKYKFVNVNNAFCKATGYSLYQVLNQYTTAIIPEPSIHLVHQKYAEAINSQKPIEWEETTVYAGVEKTGLVRVSPLFDADGKCVFLIGNVHDVTEIKLAVKRAEESLNKLNHQKFALDQHSIVAVTNKKGDIIYVNDKFCEISGFEREELLGQNHRIINSGVHQRSFFDEMYKAIYSGEVWHGDICNKRKDGALYWVRTTIVPFYDTNSKELSQFISIRTDITEEKANLDALQKNEEYLRTIFDYSLTAIIVADDQGNYIDVNPYACSLFGSSKEEMLMMNVADINVTKHKPAKAMYQDYVKKGIDNGEFHFINKKGKEVATLYQAIRIRKDFNVSIMVDITERINYQRNNEATQQMLEEVFNAVSDVIYVLDVEENNRLKYVTINKSFEKLTGLSVDDRINKYVDDVILGQLKELEMDKYLQAINNKTGVVFEAAGWYPTGKRTAIVSVTPLINKDGKCFRLVCSARDITDIIDSQNEINKLSLIARETTNVAIITDKKGKITWVNRAFETTTGFTFDEAMGKKPGDLLQGEESDKYVIEYMHHQLINQNPFDVEIINYHKTGKKYWTRIQCQPLFGPSGEVDGFFAIESDVTKEKETQLELELLIKELTEKNYDLKQFTYITSHNLRAPLTNLVAISELLVLPDNIDEDTRKLIEGFKISTHRLNETLDDLIRILLLKESTHVDLKNIRFEEALDKIKHSLNMLIHENGAKINANFTEAPEVFFSAAYLESIFLNLITNSLKYKSKERKPVINVQSKMVDGKLTVEFSDNGSGFDANRVKERVFRLYQRFHNNKDSKGIGLYLIKSQITALGGNVDVKSEVGKGTTFILTFA